MSKKNWPKFRNFNRWSLLSFITHFWNVDCVLNISINCNIYGKTLHKLKAQRSMKILWTLCINIQQLQIFKTGLMRNASWDAELGHILVCRHVEMVGKHCHQNITLLFHLSCRCRTHGDLLRRPSYPYRHRQCLCYNTTKHHRYSPR